MIELSFVKHTHESCCVSDSFNCWSQGLMSTQPFTGYFIFIIPQHDKSLWGRHALIAEHPVVRPPLKISNYVFNNKQDVPGQKRFAVSSKVCNECEFDPQNLKVKWPDQRPVGSQMSIK